ncbi:MAG: cupin domain-containing protein [Candidatus Moranbacteria bacterium]|nr:cupin domain-containing protein [Candidatus Moranbacteria bacterium]
MNGFITNIEKKTLSNENYREVLFTTKRSQLVVMTLKPKEDIPEETHEDHDQFIRIEQGFGKAILNGEETQLKDGSAVIIPAGTKHRICNTSETEVLKLYTIYTPPEHAQGTIHKTKEEADEDESHQ